MDWLSVGLLGKKGTMLMFVYAMIPLRHEFWLYFLYSCEENNAWSWRLPMCSDLPQLLSAAHVHPHRPRAVLL